MNMYSMFKHMNCSWLNKPAFDKCSAQKRHKKRHSAVCAPHTQHWNRCGNKELEEPPSSKRKIGKKADKLRWENVERREPCWQERPLKAPFDSNRSEPHLPLPHSTSEWRGDFFWPPSPTADSICFSSSLFNVSQEQNHSWKCVSGFALQLLLHLGFGEETDGQRHSGEPSWPKLQQAEDELPACLTDGWPFRY